MRPSRVRGATRVKRGCEESDRDRHVIAVLQMRRSRGDALPVAPLPGAAYPIKN